MTSRAALVTGCGNRRGIGAATARALAAAGIAVMVSDLESTNTGGNSAQQIDAAAGWRGLGSLVDEITARGGKAAAVTGDVSDEADTARFVEATVTRFGRLDILVNNAAAGDGGDRREIEEIPLIAWEKVMAINLRGAFLLCRAAVPVMRKESWGRIINVASSVVMAPTPHRTAYAASKGGLIAFTKALAFDLARTGITVNAVSPGPIRTERGNNTPSAMAVDEAERGRRLTGDQIPLGRFGEPEEVANTIAFLASEASSFMTGQAVGVNGGLTGSS